MGHCVAAFDIKRPFKHDDRLSQMSLDLSQYVMSIPKAS